MTVVSMTFAVAVRIPARPQPPVMNRELPAARRRGVGPDADMSNLCEHVLGVARSQARRQGLRGEDAEDCALEFVERMLLRQDWSALRPPIGMSGGPTVAEPVSEPWLRRCADNFARNALRQDRRVARHEVPWPEGKGEAGESRAWEGPARWDTPDAWLLRAELVSRVRGAIGRLTPAQQDLFERHVLREETVQEMAEALGRTPHALSQALLSLRRRLRGLMERQGVDEAAAREYLEASGTGRDGR